MEDELGEGELEVGEGQVDEVDVGVCKEGIVKEGIVGVVIGDVWEDKMMEVLEDEVEEGDLRTTNSSKFTTNFY